MLREGLLDDDDAVEKEAHQSIALGGGGGIRRKKREQQRRNERDKKGQIEKKKERKGDETLAAISGCLPFLASIIAFYIFPVGSLRRALYRRRDFVRSLMDKRLKGEKKRRTLRTTGRWIDARQLSQQSRRVFLN